MLRRQRKGLTLALVLQVLAVLAVTAMGLAALGIANLRQVRQSQEKSVLTHTAAGGVDEVINVLSTTLNYGSTANPKPGTTEGSYPETLPWARFFYSFDPSQAHFSVNNLEGLTQTTGSDGLAVPSYTALAQVTAGRDANGDVRMAAILARIWPYAIAAEGDIDVGHVGTVGPDPALRSNEETGTITISADSLNGSAYSSRGYGSISVSGEPKGRQNFDQPPITLPDVPIDTILANYAVNATHKFNGNQTGSSSNNGTLTIGGVVITPPPAGQERTIYVNGDLRFNGGLTVPRGVHFFVTGEFLVNGGGGFQQLANNPAAAHEDNFIFANTIRFNGGTAQNLYLFAEEEIDQNGSSEYYGVTYVRDGTVSMSGSSELGGVVITRNGEMVAPNTDITYDPRVLPAAERFGVQLMAQSKLRRVAWWRAQ